jgi:hypothetical protein
MAVKELDLDADTEAGVLGADTPPTAEPKATAKKSHHRQPGRPPKAEAELASRLDRVLGRIGDRLDERGDEELSNAIREDGKAMAGGIVDLTRFTPALRVPFLLILGLVEPVMAFGRVGRILAGRIGERRLEREMAAQAEAAAAAEYVGGVPVQEPML